MYKHKNFNDNFPAYLPTIKKAPVSLKAIFKKRKEQHKEHAESVQLRHDIILANTRQNYINEYDRINGYLSHNISHGHVSQKYLTERKEKLQQLFTKSFKDEMHELYNK